MAVETGDRHIVRNFQSQALTLKGGTDRKVIVGTEDAIELRIFATRLAHQLYP